MDCPINYRDKGDRKKRRKQAGFSGILALCIGSFVPAAFAAENAATGNVDDTQPDLEFLEFLGQFETDDGQWIDPGSLLAEEFDDLLAVAESGSPAATTDDNNADNQ